ncbi:MAG: DUF169 domain-containing protein [Candidatus Bathyarchaeia archaeon]
MDKTILKGKLLSWKTVDDALRSYLGIGHHLVGVEILKNGTSDVDALHPSRPIRFCQGVKRAADEGQILLLTKGDLSCPNAHITLGFRDPRYVEIKPRIKPAETEAVLVGPLGKFSKDPDIVLVVLRPKQMMDLTVVIETERRTPIHGLFKGDMGVCGEATAEPYMSGEPNLSFMCNGARMFAGFRDDELVFGASPGVFVQAATTIERIAKVGGALCGCRTSDLPAEIVEGFEKMNLSKGTDYFFGRLGEHRVRVYLNKDFQGRYTFLTVHLPVKAPSKKRAEEIAEEIGCLLRKPYSARRRGCWIDLSMTVRADEVGVDLQSGENVEATIKDVVENMARHLHRVK